MKRLVIALSVCCLARAVGAKDYRITFADLYKETEISRDRVIAPDEVFDRGTWNGLVAEFGKTIYALPQAKLVERDLRIARIQRTESAEFKDTIAVVDLLGFASSRDGPGSVGKVYRQLVVVPRPKSKTLVLGDSGFQDPECDATMRTFRIEDIFVLAGRPMLSLRRSRYVMNCQGGGDDDDESLLVFDPTRDFRQLAEELISLNKTGGHPSEIRGSLRPMSGSSINGFTLSLDAQVMWLERTSRDGVKGKPKTEKFTLGWSADKTTLVRTIAK